MYVQTGIPATAPIPSRASTATASLNPRKGQVCGSSSLSFHSACSEPLRFYKCSAKLRHLPQASCLVILMACARNLYWQQSSMAMRFTSGNHACRMLR